MQGSLHHHHQLLLWEFEKMMRMFASNSSFLSAKWASRFLQSAIIQGAAITFIIILHSNIISWWFNLANIGKVGNSQSISRRDFLKLMAAAGTIITFAPFVDWGQVSVKHRSKQSEQKQKWNFLTEQQPTLRLFQSTAPKLSFTPRQMTLS